VQHDSGRLSLSRLASPPAANLTVAARDLRCCQSPCQRTLLTRANSNNCTSPSHSRATSSKQRERRCCFAESRTWRLGATLGK
jgi:hypothetical protein